MNRHRVTFAACLLTSVLASVGCRCECVYIPRPDLSRTADDDCVIVPRPKSNALSTLNVEYQSWIEDSFELDLQGGGPLVLRGPTRGSGYTLEGCKYYVLELTPKDDKMQAGLRLRGKKEYLWKALLDVGSPDPSYGPVTVRSGLKEDYVDVQGPNKRVTLTFASPE